MASLIWMISGHIPLDQSQSASAEMVSVVPYLPLDIVQGATSTDPETSTVSNSISMLGFPPRTVLYIVVIP